MAPSTECPFICYPAGAITPTQPSPIKGEGLQAIVSYAAIGRARSSTASKLASGGNVP